MRQTNSVIFNVTASSLVVRTSHFVNECESHLRDLHELGSSAPLKQLRMGLKLMHQTNSVISIARGSWLFEPRSSSMCVSLTFVIRTNLDHRLLESIVERA